MLGTTFKQAAENNLLGVVIVKGQPYKTLTRPQINWIHGKLLTSLLEKARAGGDAPVFEKSGVSTTLRLINTVTVQQSFSKAS